ncbi:TetR/AcrR family transcriptional regulator [Spirillospora sp. NPDC050679]
MAEALLQVVEAEGLEAASIPRIARELDSSTGLVQTYFRSKDELLLFAAEHLGELLRARVTAALQVAGEADIKERLLHTMCVIAGAGNERAGEGRVWLAFLARAAFQPELRRVHVAGAEEIRRHCRLALEAAQQCGQVDRALDPPAEARALAAFADGLAVQRAVEPELITDRQVRDLLDRYLDRVFTGDGDRRGGSG